MLLLFLQSHFCCPVVQFHHQFMPKLLSAVAESSGYPILPIHTHCPVPHSQIVDLVENSSLPCASKRQVPETCRPEAGGEWDNPFQQQHGLSSAAAVSHISAHAEQVMPSS